MTTDEARDDEGARRLYREDQNRIMEALAGVMEERKLSEEEIVPLLIGALYHFRSLGYVIHIAKPSESGLRMDLDRMRKMIEEIHRDYRKNAGAVIRDLVAALEAMEAEKDQTDEERERVAPSAILSDGGGR